MATKKKSDAPDPSSPPSQGFPISVRSGAVSVKIYRVSTGSGGAYEAFTIADYSSGKRHLKKFSDLRKAKAEAQRIAIAIANKEGKVASLDFRDAAALVRLHEKIDPLGVSLEAAAETVAQAAKLVGFHNILEACRFFARRHPAARETVLLTQAADDYLNAKQAQGRASRHLEDITSRLGRFCADHPKAALADFTAPKFQHWLDALRSQSGAPLSAVTRRNFATVLSGFFEHFRKRGKIAENPVADIEHPRVKSASDPEFYTVEESAALLSRSPVALIPALAIGLFAGLRTAEICRLTWSNIDFDQQQIVVGRDKAKTASRRLVPMSQNLIEWLQPHRRNPEAPVWSESEGRLCRAVTETAAAASVRRIANGARHSFITYRVAATSDIPRASIEAGNSPQMIHRHYRGLAHPSEAARFFEIRPGKCGTNPTGSESGGPESSEITQPRPA